MSHFTDERARGRHARPPAGGGAHRTGSFTMPSMVLRSPRDYFLMFRERWHWGLLAAIIVANILIVIEWRKKDLYYSEASLEIQTAEENVMPAEEMFLEAEGEVILQKHIRRLRSNDFFGYLMPFFTDQEKDQVVEMYIEPDDDPEDYPSAAEIIRKGFEISVRSEEDAPFIQVGMFHRDPELAQRVSNRIAQKYIDYYNSKTSGDLRSRVAELEDNKTRLERELEDHRRAIQNFREQNVMVDRLGEFQPVIEQRVQDLTARVIEAEAEKLNATNVLAEIAAYRKDKRDLTQLQAIADDPKVGPYVTQLEELEADKRQLSQRYLERHPRMIEVNERVAAVESILLENIDEVTQTLRTNQDLLDERLGRLRAALGEAEKEALKLDDLGSRLAILQNDALNTEAALTRFTERLEDAEIESRLERRDLRILDQAFLPYEPEEPDMEKQAIWASLAGIMVFALLPVALGMLDTRLKTQWEIEDFLGTNLLGEIPRFDSINRKRRPHVAAGNNQPTLCEAFRGLYGRMELCTRVDYPKVVLIGSTVPSEGKSLIVNNLGYTFARHGRKVLMMDADFRGPSLHHFHGLDNSSGILSWLREGREATPSVVEEASLGIHEVTENLHLLPSGGLDKQPTEFFSNPRLKGLFDQLRNQYDLILLDTPPVGVFPDTLLLKPFVDEVIFVCRFRKVNKFRVRHFLDKMDEAGHNLQGVVLNGLPAGRLSAYYGYHGYGSNAESEYRSYYAKKA